MGRSVRVVRPDLTGNADTRSLEKYSSIMAAIIFVSERLRFDIL